MSDTWEQTKARLEAVIEDWEAHKSEDATELLDDYDMECLRAALERDEQQTRAAMLREIDCANLEAERNDLRQRVEELEQDRASMAHMTQVQREHAEAAENKLADEKESRGWLEAQLRASDARLAKVVEALEEIAEGSGPYNRDPLTHASNCVEAMKAKARAALAAAKGE